MSIVPGRKNTLSEDTALASDSLVLNHVELHLEIALYTG